MVYSKIPPFIPAAVLPLKFTQSIIDKNKNVIGQVWYDRNLRLLQFKFNLSGESDTIQNSSNRLNLTLLTTPLGQF